MNHHGAQHFGRYIKGGWSWTSIVILVVSIFKILLKHYTHNLCIRSFMTFCTLIYIYIKIFIQLTKHRAYVPCARDVVLWSRTWTRVLFGTWTWDLSIWTWRFQNQWTWTLRLGKRVHGLASYHYGTWIHLWLMHYDVKISGSRIRIQDLWIRKRLCYPIHHSAPLNLN